MTIRQIVIPLYTFAFTHDLIRKVCNFCGIML